MKTEKRKNELGEVFTPPKLVNEMLDKLPDELWNDLEKTWLDNSCGNGNFLVEVKRRLLEYGHSLENVLSRIHGVDIMQDNIDECRHRLDPKNEYPEFIIKNIVQADALKYHYRFDFSFPYDDIIERERLLDEKDESLKAWYKILDEMEIRLKQKEKELKKKEKELKNGPLSIFDVSEKSSKTT